jgi:long-chain acyl-CoA synthetase
MVRYPNYVATELPQAPCKPAHPGHTIARLARQIELAVATVDLTLPQYRVLGILGDGCEASSKLAEKLAVSRPSVTGVVDGLVTRGLVRRDHIADDRRRVDVGLTDAGRLVLAAADAAVEQRIERINQLLGEIPQ